MRQLEFAVNFRRVGGLRRWQLQHNAHVGVESFFPFLKKEKLHLVLKLCFIRFELELLLACLFFPFDGWSHTSFNCPKVLPTTVTLCCFVFVKFYHSNLLLICLIHCIIVLRFHSLFFWSYSSHGSAICFKFYINR